MASAAESTELVVVPTGDGLIVSGHHQDVEQLVADLARVGGAGVSASGRAQVTDLLGAAASVGAVAASTCDYVKHTKRSLALLREHGLVPSGEAGVFRSFVRGGGGTFAGNLDWSPVRLGPERALALQTAAVGLALRTAIKQVEDAVARVEGKVDRIAKLARAERLGTAIGNHHTLSALARRVAADGTISATDWSSVAGLGPAIVEDIEALRAYVRSELIDAKGGWRARGRADDAMELLEQDLVVESIGLLVVAENNLALWQALRVANVRPSRARAPRLRRDRRLGDPQLPDERRPSRARRPPSRRRLSTSTSPARRSLALAESAPDASERAARRSRRLVR